MAAAALGKPTGGAGMREYEALPGFGAIGRALLINRAACLPTLPANQP
jgi:hypothetical protein